MLFSNVFLTYFFPITFQLAGLLNRAYIQKYRPVAEQKQQLNQTYQLKKTHRFVSVYKLRPLAQQLSSVEC